MSCKYWPEISFYIREIDREKSLFRKKTITVQSIENLRKSIVHQINQLKYSLLETLEDHPTSLMLFAIAAVLDEEIQRIILESASLHWPPLSKDFYGDYTAGELFYRCVDEILDNQKIPSIVFEIFYYALKRGFRGQYRNSKIQISKYLDILKERIPQNDNIHVQTIQTIRRPLERLKAKQYYLIAASYIVVLCGSLYLISNRV